MSSDPPWLPALIAAGTTLPSALRATVLASSDEAIPTLIRVLEDPELALQAAPGGGFAPIHAARLLFALDAPEAIEPMLRLLFEPDWDSMLISEVAVGLPAFGERAFAPAMAAFECATDPEHRGAILDVLAQLGVRDERIYAALIDAFDEDPERGAMNLAHYGDPRALSVLERAFDTHAPEDSAGGLFYGQTLIELEAAIHELGGQLTPAQQQRLDDVRGQRQGLFDSIDHPAATTTVRRDGPKVGRNDPCPCGNGRKYKKCHGA